MSSNSRLLNLYLKKRDAHVIEVITPLTLAVDQTIILQTFDVESGKSVSQLSPTIGFGQTRQRGAKGINVNLVSL